MTWKYQDVVNIDLTVLLVVAVGFIAGWSKLMHFKRDGKTLSLYVFKFGLPALVLRGLGLSTNLYEGENWRFIGAFLLLRALALVAAAVVNRLLHGSLGDCVVLWLNATWISTVILGVPVLAATLGPQFSYLGVLAGVSSFLLQLPLMLILLEIHAYRRAASAAATGTDCGNKSGGAVAMDVEAAMSKHCRHGAEAALPQHCAPGDDVAPTQQCAPGDTPQSVLSINPAHSWQADSQGVNGATAPMPAAPAPAAALVPALDWRRVGAGIASRLARNHILWAIVLGFILSLSKLGYKYLDPGSPAAPNPYFVPETGFIATTLEWLGRCSQPLALLVTGLFWHVWAAGGGWRKALSLQWAAKVSLFMLVKMLMVPLLAIGCAEAVGLSGVYGRAAVLLAIIPISLAAFAIGAEYAVGEEMIAANVVVGTLLMLPATIAWLAVMDAVGLYEVA